MNKAFLLSCLLLWGTSLAGKAQSEAGSRILTGLRSANREDVRLKKIPNGNYVVFTRKNCLACFKELEDSMQALSGKATYNIILLMKEEPLNVRNYKELLNRTGIKPRSYFVRYYNVAVDSLVERMVENEPSPWLIRKSKSSIEFRIFKDLKRLLQTNSSVH